MFTSIKAEGGRKEPKRRFTCTSRITQQEGGGGGVKTSSSRKTLVRRTCDLTFCPGRPDVSGQKNVFPEVR